MKNEPLQMHHGVHHVLSVTRVYIPINDLAALTTDDAESYTLEVQKELSSYNIGATIMEISKRPETSELYINLNLYSTLSELEGSNEPEALKETAKTSITQALSKKCPDHSIDYQEILVKGA